MYWFLSVKPQGLGELPTYRTRTPATLDPGQILERL